MDYFAITIDTRRKKKKLHKMIKIYSFFNMEKPPSYYFEGIKESSHAHEKSQQTSPLLWVIGQENYRSC